MCIAFVIPLPVNKSSIFPIAITSFSLSFITSRIVFPNVFDSKSFLLYVLVKSFELVPTKGLAITVPTLYSGLSKIFLAI